MFNSLEIGLLSKISLLRQLKNQNYTNVCFEDKNQTEIMKSIKNRIMNNKKTTISQKNILLTIAMALQDIKETGNCITSSIIYPLLFTHKKVADYNSDQVIEMRKKKYAELIQNPELKKVSEQFPNFFKNSTVRQHVQSELVNQYLLGFESIEEIINDLKQK